MQEVIKKLENLGWERMPWGRYHSPRCWWSWDAVDGQMASFANHSDEYDAGRARYITTLDELEAWLNETIGSD